MLCRLIAMRHAKSDWHTVAQTDHQRPLNQRGRNDAPKVATHLVELDWIPQYAISSDSTRTRETYARMEELFPDCQSVFVAALYHGGPHDLHDYLTEIPEDFSCVLTLGHNPGWEAVVHWLTHRAVTMSTANAALMSIEAPDWSTAIRHAGHWELWDVIRPKNL